ncbi:beta, partial [Cystoisospora suis]
MRWMHDGRYALQHVFLLGPHSQGGGVEDLFSSSKAGTGQDEYDLGECPPDSLLFLRQLRRDRRSLLFVNEIRKQQGGEGEGGERGETAGIDIFSATEDDDDFYYTDGPNTAYSSSSCRGGGGGGEGTTAAGGGDDVDEGEIDLQLAVGGGSGGSSGSSPAAVDEAALFQQRLAKVQPMTGQA